MPSYTQVLFTEETLFLQNKNYNAQDDRRKIQDILNQGVIFGLTPSWTSAMNIQIAAGLALVPGLNVTDQGYYRVRASAAKTVACAAGDATNPRIDQIILRVMDAQHDTSGLYETRLEVVPGTPSAGATLANRTGAANLAALLENSKNVLLLADVLVPATAVVLDAAKVGDKRVYSYFTTLGPFTTNRTITAAEAQPKIPSIVYCDTTAGIFTLTLPVTPTIGAKIIVVDYAGTFSTNPLTVARNAKLIDGNADDIILAVSGGSVELIWDGISWRSKRWHPTHIPLPRTTLVTLTGEMNQVILCDTTSAGYTVTLPAAPRRGQRIMIVDYAGTFGTNNLTIGRNAQTIDGAAANLVLSVNGSVRELQWTGNGWRTTESYGQVDDVISIASVRTKSATGAVGYATGSGGVVVQATNKTTGVTLSKPTGQITMNAASLGAGASADFTLTNTQILANDIVVANIIGGIATTGTYTCQVMNIAAGSARIRVTNVSGGALLEAVVIQFAIVRGVSA